ncbi:hypothetical protein [Dinoroseobacter sp. S76]|uniref:hypothetical protein n=1 Tax=Dinoroseobacter sp. S76 TaxID=3415124 RepID=UPI003C7C941B
MANPKKAHPGVTLAKAGVGDRAAIAVVAFTCFVQYAFLSRLWDGYISRYAGELIPRSVSALATLMVLGGGVIIVAFSVYRWRQGTRAAQSLERPAQHQSFDTVRNLLSDVSARSSLRAVPALLYTPKNANALEVRQSGSYPSAIVVGLSKRSHARRDPSSLSTQLGHEVSHLELGATREEVLYRRVITLHFRVLGFGIAVFLAALAYLDRGGVSHSGGIHSFRPVLDLSIYVQIAGQLLVLLLSCLSIFLYSYYFLVRREHLHDLRGFALAGWKSDPEFVFEAQGKRSALSSIESFFTLHPSRQSRVQIVKKRDHLLVSAVAYPLIVSMLQPLFLLLSTGWREAIGFERPAWNLGLTLMSGLMLFALLRSDIARLGVMALVRPKQDMWIILIYALMVGLATQIPRMFLEVDFGLQREFPISVIAQRIWQGTVQGGFNVVVMVACAMLISVYVSAVVTASKGTARRLWFIVAETMVLSLVVICGFVVMSLNSWAFRAEVLAFGGFITAAFLVLVNLTQRCRNCGRKRTSAIWLQSKCSCGKDHSSELRHL